MSYVKEFGGARGASILILLSHFIPFYLVLSLKFSSGGIYWRSSFAEVFTDLYSTCSPTWIAVAVYGGFCFIQIILAVFLPGVLVKGLPVPTENNRQYTYNCNALASWYLTLILLPILHTTGIFPVTIFVHHFGSILFVAVICSDLLAVIVHVYAISLGKTCRTTDSTIYDFFMGVWLNPRISIFGHQVDLKLLSEARLSWLLLFLLTISAAVKQYEEFQTVTWPMIFIVIAQLLYVNACMKGEECIVVTWDIFYEKWGWMLIYWNLAGVPFVYTFHAHYILVNSIRTNNPTGGMSTELLIVMFLILCIAYYIWDCSLAQKINFRMRERGVYIGRKGFPQMPWCDLKNPQHIKTKAGDSLLTDGWWKYCRKPPYTTDICMSILWALSCHQWTGILPYFYPTFFICMILHRYTRDVAKCKSKYGEDWITYCRQVPYAFIPGII